MATWMAHLRIADRLLDQYPQLEAAEFLVGNIAPDSGVPNADWSSFTPPLDLSHYREKRENGAAEICVNRFVEQYFTEEMCAGYDLKRYSFYLGYYVHLLTDILWKNEIFVESVVNDREAYARDPVNTVWKWKQDWYDLDFLYLREHPDFRAFLLYEKAVGFRNDYMDIFAGDAFENRRQYITGFYREERDGLDREYPWLNKERMDAFVETAAAAIGQRVQAGLRIYCAGRENA